MHKPLLIFVHGMFCHSGVWDQMVAHFKARGYDCLAVDLPYHDLPVGQMPAPAFARISIRDYVTFLKDVIARVDREYVLIGHSMGGLIVMITASEPEIQPKSIVLLSPAAPAGINGITPSVFWGFRQIMADPFFRNKAVKMSFESVSYSMLNRLPEELRREIYDTLKFESGRAAFELGFWFMDPYKATEVDPNGIICPITIFIGTHDRITPLSVVKKTAKRLGYKKAKLSRLSPIIPPRVQLITLPRHGHWLPLELDFELLEQWLKR